MSNLAELKVGPFHLETDDWQRFWISIGDISITPDHGYDRPLACVASVLFAVILVATAAVAVRFVKLNFRILGCILQSGLKRIAIKLLPEELSEKDKTILQLQRQVLGLETENKIYRATVRARRDTQFSRDYVSM